MAKNFEDLSEVNRAKENLHRFIQQRQEKVKLLHGESSKAQVPVEAYRNVLEFPKSLQGQIPATHAELMRQRREEYEAQRDQNAARLREFNGMRNYLLTERKRLLALRDKVIVRPISPLYEETNVADRIIEDWERIRQRPDPTIVKRGWQTPDGKPTREIIGETRDALPKSKEVFDRQKNKYQKRMDLLQKRYTGWLDKSSYEPWQYPHYEICRRIVEDEMTQLLERLFPLNPTDPELERFTIDKEINARAREKAIKLIHEEILLDVTLEECEATAQEYEYLIKLSKNMANNTCIREAEVRVFLNPAGRSEDDPLHKDIVTVFNSAQVERNSLKKNVWLHTQFLHLRNPTEAELREQEAEVGVINIEYTDLPPIQLKNVEPLNRDGEEEYKQWTIKKEFWREESNYWSKFKVSTSKFVIPKGCKSVTTAVMSPSQTFLAVGTQIGAVLIYQIKNINDTWLHIYRASAVYKTNRYIDPIVHLSWSLDESRVCSTTQNGKLTLYYVSTGIPGTRETLKPVFGNQSRYPGLLAEFFHADCQNNDFSFIGGPLRNNPYLGDDSWAPKFSVFLPVISLLGTASSLCVGMTNNDLLRIDINSKNDTLATPTVSNSNLKVDHNRDANFLRTNFTKLVGKDIPKHTIFKDSLVVDLFRHHKHPIIFLNFIEQLGDMVTVDDQGYILIWRYNRDRISKSSHWFEPKHRYRISMKITLFEPNQSEVPLVRYDVDTTGLTKSELEVRRIRMEGELDGAGFRNPIFKIKNKPQNFVTLLYRNNEEAITESGAILHEVTRQLSDGLLLVYQTRVYKPYNVYADLILNCSFNSAENKLVFLLLFPRDPPNRGPWMEVINVNLKTLTACEPRIQIQLTGPQYSAIRGQNVVYMDVSQPISPFGSSYLVINIIGSLYVYSLLTGKRVIKTHKSKSISDRKVNKKQFVGLQLQNRSMQQQPTSEMLIGSSNEGVLIMTYNKGSNYINILPVIDQNTSSATAEMAKLSYSMQHLPEYSQFHPMGLQSTFDMARPGHKEAIIRSFLYECMECALQSVNGTYLLNTADTYKALDRQQAYDDVILKSELNFRAGPQDTETEDEDENDWRRERNVWNLNYEPARRKTKQKK